MIILVSPLTFFMHALIILISPMTSFMHAMLQASSPWLRFVAGSCIVVTSYALMRTNALTILILPLLRRSESKAGQRWDGAAHETPGGGR